MPASVDDPEKSLLDKTSDLRDELVAAVARLEQYADALKAEVLRLKKIAIAENKRGQA